MYDIFYISDIPAGLKKLRTRYPFAKHASTLTEAKSQAFTSMFWVVWDDIVLKDSFNFDYEVPTWDQEYIHVFKNDTTFNGVCLVPKTASISEREFQYRFFLNKKEVDIQSSTPLKIYDIFEIDTYQEYLDALENTTTEMFWMTSKNISPVDDFKFDIFFTKRTNEFYQDRNSNHAFIHEEDEKETYDGIFLLSKNVQLSKKEIEFRFPVNRKEWNIVASKPKLYDIFTIDTYQEYLDALENTTTEMFWMTSKNITPVDNFKFDLYFSKKNHNHDYDREYNHAFIHQEDGNETYDGIFLLSKNVQLSKREIEFRFPVNRKEWNIVASKPKLYDQFIVENYNDYLNAFRKTTTELFWVIPSEVEPLDTFNFDLYYTQKSQKYEYERSMNHVFKNIFGNKEVYTGSIMLMTSEKPVTEREINFRFLMDKIEHNIIASKTKLYDIVFISYNEPNADENYKILKSKYPFAKRVHKVKGIHKAHIEAAKKATTHMFWVVDGDAIIEDNFKFDYLVTRYERDIVHTWNSKNPMNNLIYGYGGVKLLPRDLTLNMDVNTPDMTTAISKRFKVVNEVSNITAFNTDPFNTWKSAFRECAKLASKTIQGQVNAETEERLNVWCTVAEGPFAINAIQGARAGRLYGEENAGNLPALSKINDFKWLEEKFKLTSVLR
jgi:hypothetical protein